jgi:hypothetical protein
MKPTLDVYNLDVLNGNDGHWWSDVVDLSDCLKFQSFEKMIINKYCRFTMIVENLKMEYTSRVSEELMLIPQNRTILWVDDHLDNNRKFFSLATSRDIEVIKATSTKEAMEWIVHHQDRLGKSQEMSFRIVSDTVRDEEDYYFGKVTNSQAGKQLVGRICALWKKWPISMIKLTDKDSLDDELKCYSLFYPEYLSLDKDYFSSASPIYDKLSYLQYTQDRRYLGQYEKIIAHWLEEISKNLFEKLKKSPDVNMEVVEVKHIHNPNFLGLHRELYLNWTEKYVVSQGLKNTILKSLLSFHGCPVEKFADVFNRGIPNGGVVTTSPLYAMHKSKQCTEETSNKLKGPKIGETVKLIGGFTVLGKTVRPKDLNALPSLEYNTKMYNVRHDVFMKDFMFSTNGQLIADEICLENNLQFLPCFEITYKRIEKPKTVWKSDFGSDYMGVSVNNHSIYTVPQVQEAFKALTIQQDNAETFNFMQLYHTLNDNTSDESIKLFQEIYENFIDEKATRCVNIFGPIRERMQTLYNQIKQSGSWCSQFTPFQELEPVSIEVSRDVGNIWMEWLKTDEAYQLIRSLKDHPDVVTQSPLYSLFWKLKNSGFPDQDKIRSIIHDLADKERLLGSYLSTDWNKTLRLERHARRSMTGDNRVVEINGVPTNYKSRQVVRVVLLNDAPSKKTSEGLVHIISPIMSLFQHETWQYYDTYHTGLMIGRFLFEFDEKEVCIPKKCIENAAIITGDIGELGYVDDFDGKLQLIAEEVVDWNVNKHYQKQPKNDYNSGNSQTFVDELLELIGLKFTVTDPMLFFLKAVKSKGSSKLVFHPSTEFIAKFGCPHDHVFITHVELDTFVADLCKKDDQVKRTFPNEWNFLKMIDRAFWMKHYSVVREIVNSTTLQGKQEKKKFGEGYLPLQDDQEVCNCPFSDPTTTRSFIF